MEEDNNIEELKEENAISVSEVAAQSDQDTKVVEAATLEIPQEVPAEPLQGPVVPVIVEQPSQVVENPTIPEKKKNSKLPIIIIMLFLICVGVVVWYFVFGGNEVLMGKKKDNEQEEKIKDSEEKNNIEEEKEKKDNKTTEPEENKETINDNNAVVEETKPNSNNVTTVQEPTNNNTSVEQPVNSNVTTQEIEEISGMVLYLYEDGGIGDDMVYFEYVSHTPSQVVVDVIINEIRTQYTINVGVLTKINGLKNKVLFRVEEDYITITFE